jgi:hypothetical protein
LQEKRVGGAVEVVGCMAGTLAIRRSLPSLLEVARRNGCADGPAFNKEERVGLEVVSHEPLKIVDELTRLPRPIWLERG